MSEIEKIKQAEIDFQEALKEYRETESIEAWQKMWILVDDCVNNMAKKLLIGIKLDDGLFYNRKMDTVIWIMNRIKYGSKKYGPVNPTSLSSYCWNPVRTHFQGTKAEHEDKEQNYEKLINRRIDILGRRDKDD